jgi:hypothetical protein
MTSRVSSIYLETTAMSKLEKALALFDEYNQQDPHKIKWNGEEYAAEYLYALQLYNWVKKLQPDASEHLLLASRAQHIGRWQTPRTNYPDGKAGYLTWRKDLAKFHAETAGRLMLQAHYNKDDIEAVKQIILKQNLKTADDVQVMENALCLLFLEFQYDDFMAKHEDDNMITRILRKTWQKMSEPGRQAALHLKYSTRGTELIEKALSVAG